VEDKIGTVGPKTIAQSADAYRASLMSKKYNPASGNFFAAIFVREIRSNVLILRLY